MNRLFLSILFLACSAVSVFGMQLDGMVSIGPITDLTRTETAVTFNCRDGSQVRVTILASDLLRIRAAFRKPLPVRDHSWAIDKTSWKITGWELKREADHTIISTDEIDLIIRHSPLLIEIRDAKTRQMINADERPMMFNPKNSAVAAFKKLGFDEHFLGLGEKAARLDKRRGRFQMWNTDKPGYVEGDDPIYQSVPFYIGWQRSVSYGIFFDNSYRTYFDFGRSSQEYTYFSAEGGEMNYYFFYGPGIKKLLGRYADLTGHMPMPPIWALGNQQSRWSYYPEALAEEVVRTYRARDLPLDLLYLDINFMNGNRVFTWDPKHFPDPKSFLDRLGQLGVKVVTIVDPGIKYQPPLPDARNGSERAKLSPQEKSYYVYNQGIKKNYFLKRKNGKLYIGKVWPGKSVFVDYTLSAAREWWGDLHSAYTDQGVAGIWNDMNEPSDFIDQTGKSQMDVVSYDEGEYSTHAKNRNVFALLMALSTYEGLERLQPDRRPFVITRAAYAGIQRYSTMWTGDNLSSWDSLALSIPMFQSLGLSGQPFVGADIGGFIGRCDGELLTRWYQVGFLTPFCRNHKVIDGYDQEPWRFGKYYEDIIRKYLKLRYRLLPYLYTGLEEAHRTGVPIFRPLILNYDTDANTINIDDQFMIGSDLLVAPIIRPGLTSRAVYLPQGSWYDFWTGKKHDGGMVIRAEAPLDIVPMFVRAGGIIPMGPEMNFVKEKSFDPINFEIYPDEKGRADLSLYEDDGISPAYRKGVFRRTSITMDRLDDGFQIACGAPEGSYNPGPRNFIFAVRSPLAVGQVSMDGKPLDLIDPNGKGTGWYKTANSISIRIIDDGRPHNIRLSR
jgi:alpha-glucosidase